MADSWCYALYTLPAAIVFGIPFLACINPIIDWQAKVDFFGSHTVLGTSSSYNT